MKLQSVKTGTFTVKSSFTSTVIKRYILISTALGIHFKSLSHACLDNLRTSSSVAVLYYELPSVVHHARRLFVANLGLCNL